MKKIKNYLLTLISNRIRILENEKRILEVDAQAWKTHASILADKLDQLRNNDNKI